MQENFAPKHKDESKEKELSKIVLYNDDVNTFDFVIEMLMIYCEHNINQAEQCAMLTHYKGKSIVKKGTYKKLEPIASALLDKGLSVEIES